MAINIFENNLSDVCMLDLIIFFIIYLENVIKLVLSSYIFIFIIKIILILMDQLSIMPP